MGNVIVDNLQHKIDQMQRTDAHQYEYPDSESEEADSDTTEETPNSDVDGSSESGSD